MIFDGILSSVITIDLKRDKQIEKRMMTHNNRIGFQSDDEITTEEQIIYNYTMQLFLQ